MIGLPDLTRTEHRIMQVLLNLGAVRSDAIMWAIRGPKPARCHPGQYIHILRKKIMLWGLGIEMGPTGYRLTRAEPIRARALYMRDYRRRKASQITPGGAQEALPVSGQLGPGPAKPHQRARQQPWRPGAPLPT